MGNFSVLFSIGNIIIVSSIFWALTYVGYLLRDEFVNYETGLFYECGFKSLQNINIKFNLNSIIAALFVILYEIEFILIIPYSFSLTVLDVNVVPLLFLFLLSILATLIFDVFSHSITWVY